MAIIGYGERWTVTVGWGKNPTTGKARSISRSFHGSREAAEAFEKELLAARTAGNPDPTRQRARFDVRRLEEAAGADGATELARCLGISTRQVLRLRHSGLTEVDADRYACRLGLHPGTVWPEWWSIDNEEEAA